MTQWHPLFAKLLRPAVEQYYDLQTTVPVGDVPREADFVLLRRLSHAPLPFRGLWRHLTPWNILEFKGPSVSPRSRDVELLVELGLGIDRRLHEGRVRDGRRPLALDEVSFCYLANRLGRRFVRMAEQKLGALELLGPGPWYCRCLGHRMFWVNSVDLPVEQESLPLHLVGREPLTTEREVARLIAEQPELQELYGGWMANLHPQAWKEVEAMSRSLGKKLKLDARPIIEHLGLGPVIEQMGLDYVIEQIGEKEVIKHIDMDRLLALLSPAERRELKRRLEEK